MFPSTDWPGQTNVTYSILAGESRQRAPYTKWNMVASRKNTAILVAESMNPLRHSAPGLLAWYAVRNGTLADGRQLERVPLVPGSQPCRGDRAYENAEDQHPARDRNADEAHHQVADHHDGAGLARTHGDLVHRDAS